MVPRSRELRELEGNTDHHLEFGWRGVASSSSFPSNPLEGLHVEGSDGSGELARLVSGSGKERVNVAAGYDKAEGNCGEMVIRGVSSTC